MSTLFGLDTYGRFSQDWQKENEIALERVRLLARQAHYEELRRYFGDDAAAAEIMVDGGPRPFGVTDTDFDLSKTHKFSYTFVEIDEVVQFAVKTLKDRSPVGSTHDDHPGLYRDSHVIYFRGQEVDDVKNWTAGEQVEITNKVPYSRKIELGTMKVNAAPHVYEGAVPIINAKYGKQYICTYALLPARQVSATVPARSRSSDKPSHAVWQQRQPTLLIKSR